MLRIAGRVHFHSPEDVGGYVDQAMQLLDVRQLTEPERAQLLPAVVNLLAQSHVEMEQVVAGGLANGFAQSIRERR